MHARQLFLEFQDGALEGRNPALQDGYLRLPVVAVGVGARKGNGAVRGQGRIRRRPTPAPPDFG